MRAVSNCNSCKTFHLKRLLVFFTASSLVLVHFHFFAWLLKTKYNTATNTYHTDYRRAELQSCSERNVFESLQICKYGCSNAEYAPDAVSMSTEQSFPDKTVEVVQAAFWQLWKPWHKQNGSIDLFVRSSCNDRDELYYLFKSVEIFWPLGVGTSFW